MVALIAGGAIFTAVLFNLGKTLIGFYIGSQGFSSTYGAMGGLFALLAWIYHSSQIVLFGAELTAVSSDEST